jgi:hypothetical protein
MTEHADLIAARRALDDGDASRMVRIAFQSRAAMNDGVYCDCSEPLVTGDALMCGACLHRNKDQEIKAIERLVGAHDFVPGELEGILCKVCTMQASAPRHHGIPSVGRTSWGTEFTPRTPP